MSSYSGSAIRTTHMTGIATDIGLITGRHLMSFFQKRCFRRCRCCEHRKVADEEAGDERKLMLLVLLLFSFLAGVAAGSALATVAQELSLLVPAIVSFIAGIAYMIWQHNRAELIEAGARPGFANRSAAEVRRCCRDGASEASRLAESAKRARDRGRRSRRPLNPGSPGFLDSLPSRLLATTELFTGRLAHGSSCANLDHMSQPRRFVDEDLRKRCCCVLSTSQVVDFGSEANVSAIAAKGAEDLRIGFLRSGTVRSGGSEIGCRVRTTIAASVLILRRNVEFRHAVEQLRKEVAKTAAERVQVALDDVPGMDLAGPYPKC
ncbi:unnamed protein product [Symbiodinium sp. KB8]|nr:unnamed protein product [Symbiodinium sp. KB8]